MNSGEVADPAKAGKLAQQIVSVLMNEDSVTRQRAIQAAMLLLGESTVQLNERGPNAQMDTSASGDDTDLAAFFSREGDLKPADYANLCAAYHYSLYGAVAFSIDELKKFATEAGVIIPDRADMTIRNAMQKGKKLFQSAGAAMFKPTAAGCLAFKEKWEVKPGRKIKPMTGKGANGAEAD